MSGTSLTTIDDIDGLVAERILDVPRRTVVGEFIAAPNLRETLTWTGKKPIWIGSVLQVADDYTALFERDLVAVPERLRDIDRFASSKFARHLAQLSGHQVTMEVEPVLAPGGVLKLKLWRVRADEELGCWTEAKALERQKLAEPPCEHESEERPVVLADLPRRITVIAPHQGSASRSDVRRLLSPSRISEGVGIHWVERRAFVGPGAPQQIAAAVREADRNSNIILLMRGGGGRADFWPFETAVVGRAIQQCTGVVITALGHEENRSLADDLADHSFAVPRAAADAIVAACDRVQKERRGERSRQKRGKSGDRRIVDVGKRLQADSTALAAVRVERDALRGELAGTKRDLAAALVARDAVRAELGGAMLRMLEPGAGHDAVVRMRDAVHIRYLSTFPVLLTMFFGYAGVTGAEGADRPVWAFCAVLAAGSVAACWAAARHLSGRARTLIGADR